MNKFIAIVSVVAGFSVCAFACSLGDDPGPRLGLDVEQPKIEVNHEYQINPALSSPELIAPPKATKSSSYRVDEKAIFCKTKDLLNGYVGEKVLVCEYI